jgi:hypothetical protein
MANILYIEIGGGKKTPQVQSRNGSSTRSTHTHHIKLKGEQNERKRSKVRHLSHQPKTKPTYKER